MPQPADWYVDPTNRYEYRYWDGSQWTNQVSGRGRGSLDPTPLDPAMVATPPAPGSRPVPVASMPDPPPPPQPAVQVSQKISGTGLAAFLGALVVVIAIIVLIIALASGSEDDTTETTVPTETTEEPAP